MAKPDWDSRIGRRVRLRDLHILFAVVQHGSMAKAGTHLGMSQSAVSQAIAALEHALEVPLLDRTPRGVEPNIYGTALMRRGQAAFDELRSGVKDIEVLTDPEVGEVRIACTDSMAAGILPAVIERFSLRFPKVKLNVLESNTYLRGCAALYERTADVLISLSIRSLAEDAAEQLQAEVLFYDRICLAASLQSPLARRRKIGFADLANAALISPASDVPGGAAVIEAFRTAGLPTPQIAVTTLSVHVRTILSMSGRFIAVLPASILRFNPGLYALKELPLDLPMPRWPALMVTLKNRTLSPVIERFMACAREIASVMHAPSPSRKGAMQTGATASGKVSAGPTKT
jgi:DNA-binding transcriptional LysR family regulator